jgi:uncharacterized protein (DUF1778 family)
MTTKTERLEMRLTAEQKQVLERAALLNGQMLASFIRSQLMERAQEIIERHTRTVMSERDFTRFLELIDRSAEPAAALKSAYRRHKKKLG